MLFVQSDVNNSLDIGGTTFSVNWMSSLHCSEAASIFSCIPAINSVTSSYASNDSYGQTSQHRDRQVGYLYMLYQIKDVVIDVPVGCLWGVVQMTRVFHLPVTKCENQNCRRLMCLVREIS